MTMRIRLLGRMGVEGDGCSVDGAEMPGRQGRLVLAYLALNHHPVARSELAELVWSDRLPRSWERDMSAVVSKLKPLLARVDPRATIEGAMGCYELRLPPGATVDAEVAAVQLEEGEQALRAGDVPRGTGAAITAVILAKRPFLPGEDGEWVEFWRDRLRGVAVRGLHLVVEGYRRQGNLAEAARLARSAIEIDPHSESSYATLMRLHLDMGNRAQALLVYERCRERLLCDLGVPPAGEAAAVHRRALRDDLDEGRLELPPPAFS